MFSLVIVLVSVGVGVVGILRLLCVIVVSFFCVVCVFSFFFGVRIVFLVSFVFPCLSSGR